MAHSITEKLTDRIHNLGRGSAFTPKDFQDIASHETARQILSRLAKEGKIRRLAGKALESDKNLITQR